MAKTRLYSDRFESVDPNNCPQAIREAFADFQKLCRGTRVHLIRLDTVKFGIACEVSVSLPTRGTVGSVDIRPVEPLLFILDGERFPYQCPEVRTNRLDFPKSLPHLNPVQKGEPVHLCIHRGNVHDWFAEHSIQDLVGQAREWLCSAAGGRLIPEGDRFEPTRVPETAVFHVVFPYAQLAEKVEREEKAGCFYEVFGIPGVKDSDAEIVGNLKLAWHRHSINSSDDVTDLARLIYNTNRKVKQGAEEGREVIGLLVHPGSTICSQFFGSLPSNVDGLQEFSEVVGAPIREAVKDCISRGARIVRGLILLVAVRRPSLLIGRKTSIEILPFLLFDEDDAKNSTPDMNNSSTKVIPLIHIDPLNTSEAATISGLDEIRTFPKTMLVGCGALGSKIGLHLGRAGFCDLTLVDKDRVLPHNLVRHALLRKSV